MTTITTVRTVREYVAGDDELAVLQYQGLAGTFGPAAVTPLVQPAVPRTLSRS